ncbi:MAG: hypothetical protein N2234_04105, partial [Planctomycetota bacterium]|nr:hypothetical protein [Planctomycetota bacterium]
MRRGLFISILSLVLVFVFSAVIGEEKRQEEKGGTKENEKSEGKEKPKDKGEEEVTKLPKVEVRGKRVEETERTPPPTSSFTLIETEPIELPLSYEVMSRQQLDESG